MRPDILVKKWIAISFAFSFSIVGLGQRTKIDSLEKLQFKVISCKGDLEEKTVTLFFKITNLSNISHVFHITDNGKAKAKIDTSAVEYACKIYTLGKFTGGGNFIINSTVNIDTPILGSITYKNIPTEAKAITKATFFYYDNLRDSKNDQVAYQSGIIDLGEINIEWRRIPKPKIKNQSLNIGIGIKNIYFKDGYSESNPINTSVVYERKIKNLPLTIGGAISYSSHTYMYENDYGTELFSFKENAVYAGLRVNGYFNNYLGISRKYETYVGISGGYIFLFDTENTNNANTAKSGFASGLHIGAKRYITTNLGLWVEGGTSNLSYINGGLTFKF